MNTSIPIPNIGTRFLFHGSQFEISFIGMVYADILRSLVVVYFKFHIISLKNGISLGRLNMILIHQIC